MPPKKIFQVSTQKYLVEGKGFVEWCILKGSEIEYFQASLMVKILGEDYKLCDRNDECFCQNCEDDC